MGDVTILLDRWAKGDAAAFRELVPIVYSELHALARHYLQQERRDHTLQPTALIHEAYLRLAQIRESSLKNRAHFYGVAANVMRRVLVDHARRRKAQKRGSGETVAFDAALDTPAVLDVDMLDLVALDEALDRLASVAPLRARVVELRYFGGLSVDEIADVLSISPATVRRHWAFARAWLLRALQGHAGPTDPPRPHQSSNE